MKIRFSKKFAKQYEKADGKIQVTFVEKLNLFKVNPLHPLLNNHSLKGNLQGSRSINVTGDWRATYSQYINDQEEIIVIFEMFGTHSQLYKK